MQSLMSPNIHLRVGPSLRIGPPQGQRKNLPRVGIGWSLSLSFHEPNSVTWADTQMDVTICMALYLSH